MNPRWQELRLKDVCKLINGRAYSQPELLPRGKYRVLRVGNFFTNDHWYYSDLELDPSKYCDNGDLLYAWSASFGPRVWRAEKVIFHYHIWKVVPDPTLIDQKFLYYFFLWDKESIKEQQGTGTTMIHVSKGSMEERLIHLPPLGEQRMIARKLDELMASYNKIREELIRVPRLADRYKQAVLTAAFRGDLSAGWRTLNSRSMAHWQSTSLGAIAVVGTGATPKRGTERYYKDGTIPWVTSGAVNEESVTEAAEKITAAAIAETNCKVYPPGTLLVAMYGEGQTRGKVAILAIHAATNQALAAISIRDSNVVDRKFLFWLLRANYLELREQAAGGVQPNLNLSIIKALPVSLPVIDEQREIVLQIEQRLKKMETASRDAMASHKLVNRLEYASLKKAFTNGCGFSGPN